MSYHERIISKESLEEFLRILDSDEGLRLDDKSGHIFINKTSKRYCISISKYGRDEFIYKNNVHEVMDFLKDQINQTTKIFSY
jgi:hypothetical protein